MKYTSQNQVLVVRRVRANITALSVAAPLIGETVRGTPDRVAQVVNCVGSLTPLARRTVIEQNCPMRSFSSPLFPKFVG